MNVLIASHCGFTGNSALHVLAIARELATRGHSPLVSVPDLAGLDQLGSLSVPVLTHGDAVAGRVAFPDSRGVDLIHAFTPRELVREVTEEIASTQRCPYVVHLEDNEWSIVATELEISTDDLARLPASVLDAKIPRWRTHPVRAARFLRHAAGMTVVVGRLLEFRPENVPAAVFSPGFDSAILEPLRDRGRVRSDAGVAPTDFLIVYNGDVHPSNLDDVRSLYGALALLRNAGHPVTLVKTGWNKVDMRWVEELGVDRYVRDLGFLPRQRVLELLRAADVLVQPGQRGDFNDYRFPSKLPEFLASGNAVILPPSNLGTRLTHGREALLLDRADAAEIAERVLSLVRDPDLRTRLGEAGRAFALRELTWRTAVDSIEKLYARALSGRAVAREGVRVDEGSSADGATRDVGVKPLAFYLPQFHRIRENDEWWGEGFTEWTNVTRARPLFDGHFQPQLPTALGMYDLTDPEVMEAQARLACAYGLYGFCFYYYWFDRRRVLERPIDRMLDSGRPKIPFCFCWANENWTRRWDGRDAEVLLRQEYDRGWWDRFIYGLLPAFADARYIQVAGAPLLLVYRAEKVPGMARIAERWRRIVQAELGRDLHLAAVQSFGLEDPTHLGFDAAVEFPPHNLPAPIGRRAVPGLSRRFRGDLHDYRLVRAHCLSRRLPDYRWYRGVMPSWDNTARRGLNGRIIVRSSPAEYRTWLRKLVLQTLIRASVQEPLIFINAWNEWAEGTHLEPDERYGYGWLEATHSAIQDGLRQFYSSRRERYESLQRDFG